MKLKAFFSFFFYVECKSEIILILRSFAGDLIWVEDIYVGRQTAHSLRINIILHIYNKKLKKL